LITHGETGRSGVGRARYVAAGATDSVYGASAALHMKTCGLIDETLATVSVLQREWAGKNPRATFKDQSLSMT
jgi:acetyl-CoA acetyltransferase